MNFYKRHIGDYIRDTAHLSLLEHGVYTRLLDVYYSRESAIPAGQAARLIGARAKDEREAVERVLEEFFELDDDGWSHHRCDREIAVANEKAERNREVGKLGGRPRKNGSKEKPTENPDGFQKQPEGNPSQTPDTRLQTPDKGEGERETRAPERSPTGSRIPDAFPSELELAWCKRERPDLQAEAVREKFRDYWLGVPGSKGRKSDWPATWRNFVRNEFGPRTPRTAGRESTEEHNRRAAAEFLRLTADDGRTIDA